MARLPGAGHLTYRDTRDFFRKPAGTPAGAASTRPGATSDGGDDRASAKAARKAFTQRAPGAARANASSGVRAAASKALAEVARSGTARAAEATPNGAGKSAGGAARAALSHGGTSLARAAGRFAPGENVAIALADTAVAASTLADGKATVGKKVTTSISALGSIVSATHLPVVSQAGAAISTVSGVVGSFF